VRKTISNNWNIFKKCLQALFRAKIQINFTRNIPKTEIKKDYIKDQRRLTKLLTRSLQEEANNSIGSFESEDSQIEK
jgi:hypothetical protein